MKFFWVLYMLSFFIITQDVDWKRVTLKEHGCTLLFSGDLEHKSSLINTSLGELEVLTSFYNAAESDDPNELYLVNTTKYPLGYLEPDSTLLLQSLMDDTVTQLSESLYGELDYHSELVTQEFKYTKFRISYNNRQAVCKGRLVINGNNLHLLQVFSTVENSLNDEIDVFLNSFGKLFETD